MQLVYASAVMGLTFSGLALVGLSMPGFSAAETDSTRTEVQHAPVTDESRSQIEPGKLRIGGPDVTPLVLDLAALDELEQESFETGTIWTDGESQFSGVPVAALIEAAGLSELRSDPDAVLEMTALNDYRVRIPLSDIEDRVPIVATRIDGETVSIREKGPFWIVYPYDRGPEYRTEEHYKRSIWQLAQMTVTE
ncbi:hypothetical protein T8T21_08280 [Limimaricola variabilis]|uniref:hypothetical protein n=1 Tax=Limimaricola variabilis TaxID=1492771 RepID=UPI002AC8C7C9|nr:hypothetical protein [Limimaricola variabilis]WPY93123.1 hypothetical protein T8T21_08280 [Limimaricola variabilis]